MSDQVENNGRSMPQNDDVLKAPPLEQTTPAIETVSRVRSTLRKIFSFPGFLGVILVLEAYATLVLYPHDPDTWWHIVVGNNILKTHSWPVTDLYSFTAHGNVWIAYEWLGEVIMALANRAGGLAGLALLRIGIAAVLALLLYYYADLRCRNSKAAFVATALMFWLTYGFLWLRPQLLGYLFLLLVLVLVERYRQGQQKSLWALPFIFLFWVNTHGSFIFGLVVLGIYWVSGLRNWELGNLHMKQWEPKQRRHVGLIFFLSVVALLITPYGSRLAAYPFEMTFSQPLVFSNIAEWGPIGFGEVWGKEVLILFLILLVALAVTRPLLRLEEFALLFFAMYTACVHRRLFVVFTLIATPFVASLLARWVPEYKPNEDHHALNSCLMGLAAAGMIWLLPSRKTLDLSVNRAYPNGAVQYIRDHPGLNPMFNEEVWGGYLIWSLGSPHKVFIDGRIDLYEYAGVFTDYFHMMQAAPQTPFLLRKYSIKSCLLMRGDALGTILTSLPDWHPMYEDDMATLYVHEPDDSSLNSKNTEASALDHGRSRPGNSGSSFHANNPAEQE